MWAHSLCDFGILNSHISCNMSCEQMFVHDVRMRDTMKKLNFSAILADELINFTAFVDSDNMTDLHSAMSSTFER